MEQAVESQKFCAGHLVQFYKKSEYLAESVAEYIHLGLARGDGILVLATCDHWQSLQKSLLHKDPSLERHLLEQRLLFVDAHLALREIVHNGRPNKSAFLDFITKILQPMHAYKSVRAYGELVDLLCADGKINEALELEQYWNEILQTDPRLSLMCGYHADHVGEFAQPITDAHSHLIQVENISQLDDEEALYRRIAVLEQRYAALKHNYQENVHIKNELTAIKKQLTQSGKLSILSELCAGIAHEMNNPLAIILGSIRHSREMVARAAEPVSPVLKEVLKRLDSIDDASARMTKIVRNFLMFARQQEHSRVAVNLKSNLQKSIEFMRNSLRLEQIQLQFIVPSDELYALGDADALLQAFVNIMSNARDAMASKPLDAGRILIISAQMLRDQKIEISFRDSGIGMDEQTLGKLFYPFFTTKGIGKGTGLGLAISHGIITRHKGQILCESTPGQGTLVRVLLPQLAESSAALRA